MTYTVWMNILKRVPNSVLWLLEYPIDAKENLYKEAEARGVDRSRILITPKVSKHEHIERCHLADLSLDNPITNGHTTTCDLLWSGLPIITYPISENMPSRVAASLCCALECPEMVVQSYQDYEEQAVRLALPSKEVPFGTDTSFALPDEILKRPHGSLELKYLRAKVQSKRVTAPLFNTKLWVHYMEMGLLEAWKRYL
jgi:protein O-GlcNAc transferase